MPWARKILSTHPGRGATSCGAGRGSTYGLFLSTHPGRGATYTYTGFAAKCLIFLSTHPGRGATYTYTGFAAKCLIFLSTHPGRGATRRTITHRFFGFLYFYPRTPGGVRPRHTPPCKPIDRHFYPRTPGGVRLFFWFFSFYDVQFLSTHPGRGATLVDT